MDCRGSQRGSRETSSLCNKSVVTSIRVVTVGTESGPIWAMLHFGLGERFKDDLVDAWGQLRWGSLKEERVERIKDLILDVLNWHPNGDAKWVIV